MLVLDRFLAKLLGRMITLFGQILSLVMIAMALGLSCLGESTDPSG
jgi:hypothetical protein